MFAHNIDEQARFVSKLLSKVRARWPKEEGDVMYNHFNEVFSYLPLSALISKQILCMHGGLYRPLSDQQNNTLMTGLSPRLTSLKDLQSIERPIIMPKALAQDILWADPEVSDSSELSLLAQHY